MQLFIVSGPSAVGKRTVVERLLAEQPTIQLARSSTTRECREGEVDGVDYDFISRERFSMMARNGGFAEWAEVHGEYYGTPAAQLMPSLPGKEDTLLEIDFQGAWKIKERYPTSQAIFLLPPTYAELERRMRVRGREKNESEIQRRLATARTEIEQAGLFDVWIINDDLDQAVKRLVRLVAFIKLGGKPLPMSYRDLRVLDEIRSTFPISI